MNDFFCNHCRAFFQSGFVIMHGDHFRTRRFSDVRDLAKMLLWGFAKEIWGNTQEEFAGECARRTKWPFQLSPYDWELNLSHDTAFYGINQVLYGPYINQQYFRRTLRIFSRVESLTPAILWHYIIRSSGKSISIFVSGKGGFEGVEERHSHEESMMNMEVTNVQWKVYIQWQGNMACELFSWENTSAENLKIKLSNNAGLSRVYTDHWLRTSSITSSEIQYWQHFVLHHWSNPRGAVWSTCHPSWSITLCCGERGHYQWWAPPSST